MHFINLEIFENLKSIFENITNTYVRILTVIHKPRCFIKNNRHIKHFRPKHLRANLFMYPNVCVENLLENCVFTYIEHIALQDTVRYMYFTVPVKHIFTYIHKVWKIRTLFPRIFSMCSLGCTII